MVRIWRNLYLVIVSIGVSLLSTAQNDQMINCLVVNPDGSVTITWEQYDNLPSDFNFYQPSRIDPVSGIPILLGGGGIFDINQTSFTDSDISTDANVDSYCYQILLSASSTSSSDLCTIYLEGNSNILFGVVDLTWNDPVPAGSEVPEGSIYKIYYEFPAGNWILDSFREYTAGDQEFVHEVKVCDDFVNFRVDLEYPNSNCASSSNVIGFNVEDKTAPEIPLILSVSVDPITQLAVIDWNSVNISDIAGYNIYQCIGNSEVLFDSTDETTSIYTDTGSTPNIQSEGYLITSFDDCPIPNESTTVPPDFPTVCPSIYTTMFLDWDWVVCQDYIDLAWTPYTGWGEEGVAFYEIYRRTNNGPDEFLSLIEPENGTNFRDNSIDTNTLYSYYVKAQSASGPNATSLSNLVDVSVTSPLLPNDFGLFSASVTNGNEISILTSTSITTDFFEYSLLRKTENEAFFQEVGNFVEKDETFIPFTDTDVDPSVFSYTYQVALIDQCGDTVTYSNLGKTMLLDGLANEETLINTISWNSYLEWDSGIRAYDIYRSVDGGPSELIASNQENITFFEDDVSELLESKGEFCYYIEASESSSPLGLNARSLSNLLCLTQPPKVWIPNTFTINGVNPEFKPVISFADRDTYKMLIYNRWGQQVFNSSEISEGWDGTKSGILVQEGNYMYYIGIRDGAGQLYEYRGHLTMLISN